MEQQREAYNLIIIFSLTIASIHPVSSSSQNLYTFTTTIDIGSTDGDKITDHAWLRPLNATTSIYQDSTTYLPVSTTVQVEEILDSSETKFLNRYSRPSYQHNEHTRDDDDPEGPPDHVIPYSEHEEARDVPTQPRYVAPGIWAKPAPEKNIPLDFVPTKLHAQVRGVHTVKRLPQREAIESAETDEERRNAHRLRKVVTNSKVNTVYTEEGYEDSAYDHAGHIRDADFHEGFARKLHDQKKSGQNSSSGKKKKGKSKNLVPDEFKEYEEDYQDHLQENRKFEETDDEDNLVGYGRKSWEGSEIDPKFVAENNIQKLEEDIEKDAEEAEKSSKIYPNAQETKLRNDIKIDSSELEEPHVEDNLKHENKPIKTKKKKFKSQNKKDNIVSKGTKQLEQKKKPYPKNYGTTVLPPDEASLFDVETPVSPHGFVTSFPNSQIYSVDQTTLRYVAPTASVQQVDEPTTISYSQLFWDYFKAKQGPSTTESSILASNSTTMNPQPEARTPIAVATIDGHGPYLLVTKEKTMTPSAVFDPRSFRPRNLFSDDVELGPSSIQGHSRHLLGQNHGVDYVNNVITTSTVATFTVQPLLLQPLSSLNPEDAEHSSSTALVDTTASSTPAVMTLNFTQEAYTRIADYHENPFLSPILDNSNIAVTKNKLKYKVLARAKPSHEKKPVKSVTRQSSHQQVPSSSFKEENEYKQIHDELNTKYNKMLNYIKNKQKTQSFPEKKKIAFPEDLTLRRPPIQRTAYSILSTHRPSAVNHSSVSAESESSRDTNWRSLLQDQYRSQPVKLPFRFDPFAQPVHPVYRQNPLPTTKLSPPPLPSTYTNYHSNKQNDNHFHLGGKPQQRHNNAFRYFPLIPDPSWRTRARRKRSDEGEFHDGDRSGADIDVKAATNNGVTNDDKSEQQNEGSFDRVIDRLKGKLSSRRTIDAQIDVPDATRLASPARGDKSGTSKILVNKNSTIASGESKNLEDTRETIIGNSKIVEKKQLLIQLAKQVGRTNDMNVEELAKKKRDVRSKTNSTRNLKNEINQKSQEKLLNESPKISGDVIDKEIAARFNENDNNETSSKIKKNEKIEVEVPSLDYIEELVEDDPVKPSTTTEAAVDSKKYPFYKNKDVPSASALKYVIDPKTIPRKTSRGMEFYDSRNTYKQCDEMEPNLDQVLPEKEEPDPERGPQEDLPRLRGLGDKLDCFKAKYFDENPLDNPLFAEKLVEEPSPPTELNPMRFASKIVVLPEENDEYVVHQVSKKPERSSRQWRYRNRPYETHESIRVNYKHDPQNGRERNAYLHTVRGAKPSNAMRRLKNRRSRPKISSTTASSPKLFQTTSYQNQVYEDVMGNIRNMKNAYQVYEMTTLPPSMQILAGAGSENMLKIADDTPSSSKKKSTSKPDVTDVTDVVNNTRSSEIKGLVPPPKYLTQRQMNYRKQKPLAKSRVSLLRSPNLPQIIAHHRIIKINKRSTMDDTAKNSSESTINENKKTTVNESVEVNTVGNGTIMKSIEEAMKKTNATSEPLDLEIGESRKFNTQDQSLSTTLKIDDKKRRKNSTSSDRRNEPQKAVYTIRDRIRYSKPKWDMRGFGKFSTSSKTAEEDSRRKEPRYNYIKRKKKPVGDRQNNSTIMNSTGSTSGIESATLLIEDGESSTTDVYSAEESAVQETIYRKEDEYPEPEKTESIDTESEENLFEEEEEEESTTNTYQVHENVDENFSTTTTRSTNPQSSKEVLDLREYLESDPPGYAETFSEEATTPSSKHSANINHESEDSEEKQDEETDYPKNVADNDSSEKIEEQVETPMKTELFTQDDDSEEPSSKEEEGSDKDQTFFTYPRRPLIESDKNDERSEKTTFRPFPFSRYKSKFKKESEEDDEESEEKSEDYVFPWHADREDKEDKHKWLHNFDRYEYPWERRERLARERQRKRKQATRIYDDEDEEESTRRERPIYPWERYDLPSKAHTRNIRRDLSRRYIDDNEESNAEHVPLTKFSSKYSSKKVKPSKFTNAHEISRSIKKFLEEDEKSKEEASKEIEDRSHLFARKSSPSSNRGISRGTLVPEDITQPPRRKNARRKIPQPDKSVSNNSRFDLKKLRSEEIINEKEKEEPVKYLKLSKSNLDNPESPTEITSSQPSQLSNGTEEIPTATEQHKKRRRRILKNNSTVSLDNAPAESITKPTKKRRMKPEASTTTTATPSASTDFGTRKSIYTPVRKRYSKKGEETNRSDSSEKTAAAQNNATSEITKAENHHIETSTPKIRTIEHRSRVSKEKIVTKTTYPDETENFDSMKTNRTSARKEPVKKLRIKSKRRKSHNKQDGNNEDPGNKSELIKQEDKKGNYEVKFVNENKKSVILDEPQDKSKDNPFRGFGMKKEEVRKINDFSTYDGVVNDENDNDGFGIISEIYAVRNLMQNIPPHQENQVNNRTESESNRITKDWKEKNNSKEANEEEKEEEKRRPLSQIKFIKDPERRLYYYVERK